MDRRAFSMIELVIVVVIVGIVAAIAIPRMGGITDRAQKRRVIADLSTLQKAAELYAIEHGGVNLAKEPNGSTAVIAKLVVRLIATTDEAGNYSPAGLFGPYVRTVPVNAINELDTIRIDGAAPGAGTHGWHFDSVSGNFAADTTFTTTLPDGSQVDHRGIVTPNGADLGGGGGADVGGGLPSG